MINIKKMYIWNYFSLNVFITSVYIIFLQSKGFSFTQISILHVIKELVIVLSEIPSGIIADKIGRKPLMKTSSLFLLFSMGLIYFSQCFLGLAVGFLLWGLAISCSSGADESLLYESSIPEDFEKNISISSLIRKIGGLITKVSGPFLYGVSSIFPFLGSALHALFSFFIALTVKETKTTENYNNKNIMVVHKTSLKNKENKFFTSTPPVLEMIILAIILGSINTLFLYYQPFASQLGFKLDQNSMFYSFIYGLSFLFGCFGSGFFPKIAQLFSKKQIVVILQLVLIFSIVIMSHWFNTILFLVGLSVQSFLHGLTYPFISSFLNSNTKSENRASVLSAQSLINSFFKGLFIFITGIIADKFSIQIAILMIIIPIGISLLGICIYKKSFSNILEVTKE